MATLTYSNKNKLCTFCSFLQPLVTSSAKDPNDLSIVVPNTFNLCFSFRVRDKTGKTLCWISDSHSSSYKEFYLLCHKAM
jgi:hypothetical protein